MLCNAMLLAEGWNSPRATICMHLAPTASRRIYQQRVGRVTRRNPGKEAGLVLDFVHPATTHDENVITLHSLLDRDVYRGGAIVVGPVRRGRGRRVRVEKRVVPVSGDSAAPPRGPRARALADRRREPRPPRAARLGRARRRPRQPLGLAPRQGDAAARLDQGAAPPLPADLRPAQPQLAAAPEGARRDRRSCATPRPSTTRSTPSAPGPATTAAPGPACCSRRSPSAASAAATRPRPGSGASPATRATCTRSTRCSAGPRPSACSACSSTLRAAPTGETPAAWSTPPATRTAASRPPCSPPRSPTPPRARRCCAAPACARPASRRASPASCFATSPSRDRPPPAPQAQGRRRQGGGNGSQGERPRAAAQGGREERRRGERRRAEAEARSKRSRARSPEAAASDSSD